MIRSEEIYPSSTLRDTALRIVKQCPGIYGIPEIHIDADFYMVLMDEPKFCYETENEIIFYVRHTLLSDACLATCWFHTGNRFQVKAVLCEGQYLYFNEQDGKVRFQFEISGLTGPTRTLYVHTLLREPGLTIRLEQNHPGRRAGAYAQQPYPETQIAAAAHYLFAMAEIMRILAIPEYLNKNGLGYLLLLGFETNNEVHGDYPPHWHIIYRWPKHCGSQAPHLYINEQGGITQNVCSIDKISGVHRTYQTNEWCKFVDSFGRDVCAITVAEDGGMDVTKPNGPVCHMSPFDKDGVAVSVNGQFAGRIQIANNPERGKYVVRWNYSPTVSSCTNSVRTILYDPLTGRILSDSTEQGELDKTVDHKTQCAE